MHRSLLARMTLLLALPSAAWAAAPAPTPYPSAAPPEQYLMASKQEEIALARTAAPASISADAEVLVLGRHGYERAVEGRNGFVCFIERAWTGGFDDAEFWNPKSRAPNCFNAPAVRSVLPHYLRRAEWVMAGADKAQLIERTHAEFASGRFTAPEPGSLSFMLSKQGYLNDQAGGPWLPHVMLFVASGQSATWAAGLDGSPILGADGRAEEPTVLLIPVRRWSDGSTPPPPPGPHQHSG